MNKGGYRQGAGRKSKAEEMRLPALMKEVISHEDWKQLFVSILHEAKGGSIAHQRLLLEYNFGKPHQRIELEESNSDMAKIIYVTPASLPPFMKIQENIS